MKQFFLFICFIVAPLAALGWEIPIGNIRGISAGYSYRSVAILRNHTDYRAFPIHTMFINLDGKGRLTSGYSSSSSDEQLTFGGFGVIFGFSAADKMSAIKSKDKYYSGYRRLSGLNNEKGDMMILGGDIRIMGTFPFSAETSIASSYFDIMFEAGHINLSYNAETGGFNKYITKKVTASGNYFGMNVGAKIFFFEVYGGLGGLFGLNYKGIVLEKKDKTVKNLPEATNHFIAQAGAGVVLDLHARPD